MTGASALQKFWELVALCAVLGVLWTTGLSRMGGKR